MAVDSQSLEQQRPYNHVVSQVPGAAARGVRRSRAAPDAGRMMQTGRMMSAVRRRFNRLGLG